MTIIVGYTKAQIRVAKLADGTGNNGTLKAGVKVYIDTALGKGNYLYTTSPIKGFLPQYVVDLGVTPPPPPPPVTTLSLYRVKHGSERSLYDPLPANVGSFDISPLYIVPGRVKGGPVNIPLACWNWIIDHNQGTPGWTLQQKLAWLLSTNGSNDMYMSQSEETGEYRIPSPGVSGGAIVNILEVVDNFGRVDVWPVDQFFSYYVPSRYYYQWYEILSTANGLKPNLVRGGINCGLWGAAGQSYYLPMEWLEKV